MHHQRLMAVCSWCVERTLRCYDVNANHDDDPPRERVVLRGNTFINLIIDINALFVDPARFDFHLRPDAHEAIDTGSGLLAPSVDLDGEPRFKGGGIDMGCDEF